MSMNPSDYDLDELRKMAQEREGSGGDSNGEDLDLGAMRGEGGSSGGADSFRAGLYRELLPLEAGGDAEKPYLAALPEDNAGERLIFEWLEFLLLHAGHQGAREAISYYESVEWITEECESQLKDYMLGLDEQAATDPSTLDVDDHLLSLVYIAKLASMN
jgi:flagellar protein FlaE